MPTRTLDSSPSILPLYARAAAPLIPGASRLPFFPGGGGEIPDLDLSLEKVAADPDAVAAYARVCGFSLRDHLPPTYPHVLAFPLQMAVMADGGFPFGAVGLVHVENRIEQKRPIRLGEELTIRVRPTQLRPHPKGRTFSLLTEVRSGREKVWEGESTMLRRGKGSGEGDRDGEDGAFAVVTGMRAEVRTHAGADRDPLLPASAEWRLGGDLGRRYASVSGDRNPIHIHALTAKPLGFPGAIAHGMWTKARCLAALQSSLPDAFAATVRFRKPILLPARVEFACSEEGAEIDFEVRDAKRGTPHLSGRVEPAAGPTGAKKPKAKPNSKGKRAK
jgi:acyl dehydratase